ncbi:ABC transporter substrate-binding protein [Nocardia sp. NBC_00881]|uniref:ABC transporter substrate-binding protein n=1 Tax=Nocardia sp. NBC_00881 TaxID=2975995 RepID=UPI00386CA83A|nr:ABC transporter substrate-binding protein [Nocardia sp. NBC_00881]
MFTIRTEQWAMLPCAALAVALAVTGCSSYSTTSTVDESALGIPNKAAGAPIKIAFSSEGKAAQFDTTPEIEAAKAAASYVNDYLGGINGRPIEINLVCENQGQPGRTRDCANKFVQSDAVALVSGPTIFMDTTLEVTSTAGLAYFNLGSTAGAFGSPNSYVMTNTLGAVVAVPATYAKEHNIQRVAILTMDVPSSVEPLRQIGAMVYGNAGVTPDIVPVPPGTPDQTPQVQAALNNHAQMFHVLGDPAFCTSALKAMRTLKVEQPIAVIGQCIGDETTAAQIPGGYADLLVAPQSATDPSAQDTKIYDAVIDKYTDGKLKTATAPTGYQAVLGFARAMTGFQGEATRQNITAYLGAMPSPQPMPLGAGITFQCGSKVVAIAPNICAKEGLLGTAEEDGTVVDIKAVDVTGLLKPPVA